MAPSQASASRERSLEVFLHAAFLLSGATGLVYEVVWSRYLTLFLGGTSTSHTIVLATFMGGLALGNALLGRRADASGDGARTLGLYGALELGIGLSCCLFPLLFAWLSELYLRLGTSLGLASPFLPVLKLSLAAASMLLPTVLMGGTLPVLAKYVLRSPSSIGAGVGRLYFVNTAGAVFGSLASGFYLVEHWGLEASIEATALVNTALGLAFLLLSRGARPLEEPEEAEGDGGPYTEGQARTVMACIAVSGGLTMLYELAWIRILILSIGGTVYSFTTMLSGFIAGIALGSFVASLLLGRRRDALWLLAVVEILLAVFILGPLPLLERLPYACYRVGASLRHGPDTYPFFLVLEVLVAWSVMLVPTTLMGAALPLASRVVVRHLASVGRGVGDVFSVNTVGTAAGAALTGFVLLPRLGLERTILAGGAASAVLGFVLLRSWRSVGAPRPARSTERLGWVLGGAWVFYLASQGGLDPRLVEGGLYRWESPGKFTSWEDLKAVVLRYRLLYSKDGADATVSVQERPDRENRELRINGKIDASSSSDIQSQLMVGHLGPFLHPSPRRVLVVGLGSGVTASAVLRHPGTEADVAEISPEVVEAAALFRSVNFDVLQSPRTKLFNVDAIEMLRLGQGTYDVVVSEPTNVWIPGVSQLFTEEFYSVVRRRLSPGGILVQWLQVYNSDADTVDSVVATLESNFPHLTLWLVEDVDLVLVASLEPLHVEPADLVRRFEAVQPAAGYTAPGARAIRSPELLLSAQIATDEAVHLLWPRGSAVPYHELHPRLEFEAARAQFVGKPYLIFEDVDERFRPLGREPLLLETFLKSRPTADGTALARDLQWGGQTLARLGRSLAVLRAAEGDTSAALVEAAPDRVAASLWRVERLGRDLEERPEDPKACAAYAHSAGAYLRDASSVLAKPDAPTLLSRLKRCGPLPPVIEAELVSGLFAAGPRDEAIRAFDRLRALPGLPGKERSALLVERAILALHEGQRGEAQAFLRDAVREDVLDLRARRLLWALEGPTPLR